MNSRAISKDGVMIIIEVTKETDSGSIGNIRKFGLFASIEAAKKAVLSDICGPVYQDTDREISNPSVTYRFENVEVSE